VPPPNWSRRSKLEIGQKDWAQREWTNLRRIKLEALLQKMQDCVSYLERYRSHTFRHSGDAFTDGDPERELDVIATLFFPELRKEVSAFSLACRTQLHFLLNLEMNLVAAAGNVAARKKALEDFERAGVVGLTILPAVEELKAAARRLLVEIMGVEERS
jgi:hypothetical protein